MWGAFEIIIIGTLATFVVTQLILPPIFGYPVCWLFKRSHKQVAEKENELAELAVQEEIVDLNKEISSKKERLGKKILEKGGVVEGESPQTEEKKK